MADAETRWKCFRCGMSFRVAPQPHSNTETTRCAECRLFYWMVTRDIGKTCVVGIEKAP